MNARKWLAAMVPPPGRLSESGDITFGPDGEYAGTVWDAESGTTRRVSSTTEHP